jgi:integrase
LQAEAPEGVPYVFLTKQRYERVLKRWESIGHKEKLWKSRWLTNNVLRDFKQHCRKAGIKPTGQLCLHTLRKNTGQNLADAGLPLNVVQKILGHSDPGTTARFYQQVDAHHLNEIRRAVDKRRAKKVEEKYVSGTYELDLTGSERK